MKNQLTISVIIPAYNEENNLRRLLPSLEKQTYPRNKMEYIVIDDGSTDNTKNLAQDFGAKVIQVETHDIELNKGIGMHAAKNDLVYWLDADMEICSSNYFELLSKPFIQNEEIVGAFTNEFALQGCDKPVKSSLLRFISHDPLQCDPLYQFFSPSIKSVTVFKNKNYWTCHFRPGNIPPCGRTMYRRELLLSTQVGKMEPFIDMESLEIVSRAGFQKFAYVPKAKIRHYHAETLRLLIKKRLRNLERDYLPNLDNKYYLWFDWKKKERYLKNHILDNLCKSFFARACPRSF